MDTSKLLRVFAVLFALLAVSNLLKPFELGAEVGFVLLGNRLSGTANTIAGPIFGVYLILYAIGLWNTRRYALTMGIVYAGYVIVNLVMWHFRAPAESQSTMAFAVGYTAVAIGVSSGSALLLLRHREQLR